LRLAKVKPKLGRPAEHTSELAAREDLNGRDNCVGTPPHLAAKTGDFRRGRSLLKCGADVNANDTVGTRPLHYAAERGDVRMTRLLLRHHAAGMAEM
jgi:ankyrin repeat protein